MYLVKGTVKKVFMEKVGQYVTRYPWIIATLVVLITAGALMEAVFDPMEQSFDNEDFLPDMEVAQAWGDYQDTFTTSYYFFSVIRDSDGDVITKENFLDMVSLTESIKQSPTFQRWNDTSISGSNPVSPANGMYSMWESTYDAETIIYTGVLLSDITGDTEALFENASDMTSLLDIDGTPDLFDLDSTMESVSSNIETLLEAISSSPVDERVFYPDASAYYESMGSDQELKDELSYLLRYNITGEEVGKGIIRSQTFYGTADSTVSELDDTVGSIDRILSDPYFEYPDIKAGLISLRADILDIRGEIKEKMELAEKDGNPIMMGLISQDYNMAAFAVNFYLTEDFDPENEALSAKGCLVMVYLNYTLNDMVEEDQDRLLEIEGNLSDVVWSKDRASSLSIHPLGLERMSERINEANDETMSILLPAAAGVVIIILSIIYRNVTDVVLNLAGLTMAIIWMYGLGSLLGYSSNPMMTTVPVLLVGLGIDYGIHLTMRYREEVRSGKEVRAALRGMSGSVGVALLLATFTTVLAFASNIASPISLMIQFGVLTAAGIVFSFIIMLTFLPAMKMIIGTRKARKGNFLFSKISQGHDRTRDGEKGSGIKWLNAGIVRLALMAERRPIVILTITLILTAGLGFAASDSEVTFDVNDFLPEGLQETDDISYLLNEFRLGGSGESGIILVYGDIADPNVLRAMSQTLDLADNSGSEYLTMEGDKVNADFVLFSMNDMAVGMAMMDQGHPYVKEYGEVFDINSSLPHENSTRDDVKKVLDLYYDSFTPLARRVIHRTDGEYDISVITLTIYTEDNKQAWELYDQINSFIEPMEGIEGEGIDEVKVTGSTILTAVIIDAITESQINSILITLIVSLVVLTVIFYVEERSFTLGGVALLPMLFCMVWILGTMSLVGIHLNVMTITIGSLTIGLGITYGIHITHRFVEDIKIHKDLKEASKSTMLNTGTALFGAASTTIAGFGVLVFALMPPLQQFGIVTALSILFSFIASVIVLPSLLVIWAKGYRRFRRKKEDTSPLTTADKGDVSGGTD